MPIASDATTQHKPLGRIFGFVTVLAVALALASTASLPAAAQQAAPAEYSQQEIEAFAAATQRVQELNQKWIPQISQAETAEDNAALRERAMQEMAAAVRDEGLTIEEYNQIYDAAQRDPAIMQEVEEHRQSLQ